MARPHHDVFAKQPHLAKEVLLEHPDHAAFAELGLKWYALPVLADMALKIGGIVYPFAPFNGYYMGTEIGARNLADANRYNQLPAVAECFGLDTSNERTLWRDRALVELNRAVLYSFDKAGISVGDHHNLGAQFEAFCTHETGRKREVSGDCLGSTRLCQGHRLRSFTGSTAIPCAHTPTSSTRRRLGRRPSLNGLPLPPLIARRATTR